MSSTLEPQQQQPESSTEKTRSNIPKVVVKLSLITQQEQDQKTHSETISHPIEVEDEDNKNYLIQLSKSLIDLKDSTNKALTELIVKSKNGKNQDVKNDDIDENEDEEEDDEVESG